ncbi:ABC transporter ATP-binding protein [Halobellus captivus]|uniref:ABC transporter ATP-binding protein n=1 Tax=Halobellus captivus TaxID=2592614 RepID=UPI0011A8D6BE|nr:ABC transporter ATP-binding protein [Halobellus captivus]
MKVSVKNLVKRYGETTAVDDISFVAEDGEFTTLLGPSGCGKTTTLRSIAGLERPDGGQITIGDTVLSDPSKNIFIPTQERNVGFVFQNFNVWPHLTVFENVAYPLRVRNYSEDEIEEKVMNVLKLTGLEDFRDRPSTQLSGGQQARVNVCRAIVYEPDLLLFDEPLTGLDRNLRHQMRYEIKRIQSDVGITTVYVTHSQPEAMTLADKIILMNPDGKIAQQGTADDLYYKPDSKFVFDFFGGSVEIEGTVTNPEGIQTDIGLFSVDVSPFDAGSSAIIGFRPESVQIGKEGAVNNWKGEVEDINFLGSTYEFFISVGDVTIRARQPRSGDIQEGRTVNFHIVPDDIFTYRPY